MRHSLRALQAFEAVARHESISKAADELGVTQSAVSHQLRKLSEEVGERLLERSGRQVRLTDAGRRLGATLQAAFLQIERSVDEAVGSNRPVLRLAICSSFAPGWLIGRLAGFYGACSNIDLQLRMYAKDPELTDMVADAFITTLPKVSGYWSMQVETENLVPVLSAEHTDPAGGRLPLITTDLDDKLGEDWKTYCALAGLRLEELGTAGWLQTSHYVLALEMARCGLGVALVPDFLADGDIRSGRLVLLNPARMPTNEDYYLCIKSSRRSEPALRSLECWFKAQVSAGGGPKKQDP